MHESLQSMERGHTFVHRVQGTVGCCGLAEAVDVMGVVLQGAVIVARRHGNGTEAERQPDVVVRYSIRWCIRLCRKGGSFSCWE